MSRKYYASVDIQYDVINADTPEEVNKAFRAFFTNLPEEEMLKYTDCKNEDYNVNYADGWFLEETQVSICSDEIGDRSLGVGGSKEITYVEGDPYVDLDAILKKIAKFATEHFNTFQIKSVKYDWVLDKDTFDYDNEKDWNKWLSIIEKVNEEKQKDNSEVEYE